MKSSCEGPPRPWRVAPTNGTNTQPSRGNAHRRRPRGGCRVPRMPRDGHVHAAVTGTGRERAEVELEHDRVLVALVWTSGAPRSRRKVADGAVGGAARDDRRVEQAWLAAARAGAESRKVAVRVHAMRTGRADGTHGGSTDRAMLATMLATRCACVQTL